jgi:hypothetical protein
MGALTGAITHRCFRIAGAITEVLAGLRALPKPLVAGVDSALVVHLGAGAHPGGIALMLTDLFGRDTIGHPGLRMDLKPLGIEGLLLGRIVMALVIVAVAFSIAIAIHR